LKSAQPQTRGGGQAKPFIGEWHELSECGFRFARFATLAGALALRYDPTNGTVSSGEIYRCGGAKGPGRMMAAFYEGSSK